MARIYEPNDDEQSSWAEWVAERPPAVRAVAERFDPWSLYRLKETGQLVTLISFGETRGQPVTLSVAVLGRFNLVPFETGVFGVNPDDLEPSELPGPDVPVGVMLPDRRDQEAYIDAQRLVMFGPSKRPQ